MTVASPCDDLTIPELFHALKQRLYGISTNGTRCVVLLGLWRACARVTLTCTTYSNSGLDLKEVRGMSDGDC